MAYKIVNDDSLTSVANAIRVQGSISGTIEFPDGFVSAIQDLSPSSNDFVITLSWDTQDEMWTIDKTYAEAYAAYQAGKTLTTTVDATDFSDGIVVGSRVWFENDANLFWLYIIWGSDTEKFGGGKHQLYGLSSLDGYYLAETHDALLYPQFESPSRTYTPTTSTQTETITYDASDDYNGIDHVGVTVNPIPSNYKDTTDATATADKILQGYTAYANGQRLTGTASGGITPSGTYSITSNGTYDVTQYASADVNVSGGGGSGDSLTLLATQDLGTLSTTSTSAVAIDTRVVVPNINDYELLIVLCQRSESVFSYHVATLGFVTLTNTTGDFHTKPVATELSSTINYRNAGGVGIKSVQYNTLGIYPSYASQSNGSVTLTLSMKYNSSRTSTINGNYTAKVYGAKIADLFNL